MNINHALHHKVRIACAKHNIKINAFVEEALLFFIKLKNN